MPSNLHYQEQVHEGESARLWLARHAEFFARKWSTVTINRSGETRQAFQDENGTRKEYIVPARFTVRFRPSSFLAGLFGRSKETIVEFQEQDVLSVLFRRDKTFTLLGEDYYLHISLRHGQMEITRTPPFCGSFAPTSREQVRVAYSLNLRPRNS